MTISAMPIRVCLERRTARDSQPTVLGLFRDPTMDSEIKEAIDSVGVDLRQEMREIELRLRMEMRELELRLRTEILGEGVATRRHFDVVAESLRDDIRIIAEGLIALDTKVESMRDSG